MKIKFTEAQIANWRDFERVRQSGCYNMFDPRARQSAKLERDEYTFVMKNYSKLKAVAEAKANED